MAEVLPLLQRIAEASKGRSAAAGHLINLLSAVRRFDDALEVARRKMEHTRNAGLGPWTQLADTGRTLQIQLQLGEYDNVLAAVNTARERMQDLPDLRGEDESIEPWNVREVILDTGRSATLRLEKWEEALSLNSELVQVVRSRGATSLELARTRFNDYFPLLRLGRYAEARRP